MKSAFIVIVLFITTQIFAQAKWIEIEPLQKSEKKQDEKKKRMLQPIKKIIDNAKIVHALIDGKTKKSQKDKSSKNWYTIKEIQSN